MLRVVKETLNSNMGKFVKTYVDADGNVHPVSVKFSTVAKEGDKREFYAEFNDYDSLVNQELLNDGRLCIQPPATPGEEEYYSAIRSVNNPIGQSIFKGYSVKMRGSKEKVGAEFFKWMSQFNDISYGYGEENENEDN